MTDHLLFMQEAIAQARQGLTENGIPIGSVLVKDGIIIARGHNRRIQKKSSILHAEMDCLENAGRLTAKEYAACTIYSTLSPCAMCTGAILLYKIPIIVIGENSTFQGPEQYLSNKGAMLINLNLTECKEMMKTFIAKNPTLWNEDIGE
ncbi:MAG: nucleoside deaminase [Candidatus Omnitrophota bacterium]